MRLNQFKNRHKGEELWVVGSDATVGKFPQGFWDGRTIIGINRVVKVVPVTYTVTKADHNHYTGWLNQQVKDYPDVVTFCSKHEEGFHWAPKVKTKGVVLFDHPHNPARDFEAHMHIPEDGLLVSQTTAGTALHLAAFMGAATVFCVGLSGGAFGERMNVDGYRDDNAGSDAETMRIGAAQMQPIADFLTARYGTRFVTVLPWANMRLGGTLFPAPYGMLNPQFGM